MGKESHLQFIRDVHFETDRRLKTPAIRKRERESLVVHKRVKPLTRDEFVQEIVNIFSSGNMEEGRFEEVIGKVKKAERRKLPIEFFEYHGQVFFSVRESPRRGFAMGFRKP